MSENTKPNDESIESSQVTLQGLLEEGGQESLEEHISNVGFTETLHAFNRLNKEDQAKLLLTISKGEAAEFLENVPDELASELVEQLTAKDAAPIVSEMDSHEQADLLGDIEEENAEAILAEMEPAEAEEARELAAYADDEAGGLMIKEFLSFDVSATVIDVIDYLGDPSIKEKVFEAHIYVTSQYGKILGVLSIRDLLLVHKATKLQEIMKTPLCVQTNSTLQELIDFFDANDFFGVPVVNDLQCLVGVVRRRDISLAKAERVQSGQLKAAGIVAGEEMRTMPTIVRSRRRLSWLSINIVLNMISASVIALYTDTLSAVIALAVFLPIVSDMSGCSGNQAVAVSMRELALGLIKPIEVLRVWFQEIKVGLINGLALGILLGGVAWIWKENPYLGLVIGLALALNTMVAVSLGGVVPLVLKHINIDPAVASGPILTTVTDLCGFFFVLSIATLMLPLL